MGKIQLLELRNMNTHFFVQAILLETKMYYKLQSN